MEEAVRSLLKFFGLNMKVIAKLYGYKSYESFKNSSAKERIMKGTVEVLEIAKKKIDENEKK